MCVNVSKFLILVELRLLAQPFAHISIPACRARCSHEFRRAQGSAGRHQCPGESQQVKTKSSKTMDKSSNIGASQAQVKTKSSKTRDKSSKIGASQAQVKTKSSKTRDKSNKIGASQAQINTKSSKTRDKSSKIGASPVNLARLSDL